MGKVPFHDDNILALYNKIRTHPLHFPEIKANVVSPELIELVQCMLVKDPARRITLAEIKVRPERCVARFGFRNNNEPLLCRLILG